MNGVDDILKDIAENMKVFSQLKREQMPKHHRLEPHYHLGHLEEDVSS